MIIKKKLSEGKSLLGTMLQITETPAILRIFQERGYDYVIIDCEHSFYDHKHIYEFAQMGSAIDMGVIVRVPEVTRQSVQNFLDFGIDGIMIPGVETPEQIRAACEMARYGPRGRRGVTAGSVSGWKTNIDMKKDICEYNNDNLIIVAQIESKGAVDDIENILDVPGIDIVLFGPVDLSNSMGKVGRVGDDDLLENIEKVLKAADKRGIATGNHVSSFDLLEWGIDRGMRVITWNTDIGMMEGTAVQGAQRLKSYKKFIK